MIVIFPFSIYIIKQKTYIKLQFFVINVTVIIFERMTKYKKNLNVKLYTLKPNRYTCIF